MPAARSVPGLPCEPGDLAFDKDGLIPVIAQQWDTREVLMLAWMDRQALARTLGSGLATYWSRSRGEYWVKGAVSGNLQRVVSVRRDCDRDALLLLVDQAGPACHTGLHSCFDSAEIAVPGGNRPTEPQSGNADP